MRAKMKLLYDKTYRDKVKSDPVAWKKYKDYQRNWHNRPDVKERRNKKAREKYLEFRNDPEYKKSQSIYQRTSRYNKKIEAFTQYSTNGEIKCAKCGYEDIRALSLDHINNDALIQKRKINAKHPRQVTGTLIYRDLKKQGWPKGFQILCYNCNWIKYIESKGYSF